MTYQPSLAKRRAHIRAATTRSGNAHDCAKALGVPYSTLLNWRERGSVPAQHCLPLREWSAGYFDPNKVRRNWDAEIGPLVASLTTAVMGASIAKGLGAVG